MNAPVTIKGWCPTTQRPMQSGDGLIVRVRVRDAALSADAALALAQCAKEFGNGQIDLTQRANLQIRGVRDTTLLPLIDRLRTAGLVSLADDIGQTVHIVTSPLAGFDKTMVCDPRSIAASIEEGLLVDEAFRALPSKFGFAIDGGGVLPLGDVSADIRLTAAGKGVFDLAIDGGDVAASVRLEDVAQAALRLARAFLGCRADERRMRLVVERIGAKDIFAFAGLVSRPLRQRDPIAAQYDCLDAIKLDGLGVVGVAASFGAWSSDDLEFVARYAAEHEAQIRVTAWRALLVSGLSRHATIRVRESLARRGLIVAADDPRRAIAACIGAPACDSATVTTRALAANLAADVSPTEDIALHVSGCAKGCAHPKAASMTLVGDAGRYALVRDGRADDAPVLAGLDAVAAQAAIRESLFESAGDIAR